MVPVERVEERDGRVTRAAMPPGAQHPTGGRGRARGRHRPPAGMRARARGARRAGEHRAPDGSCARRPRLGLLVTGDELVDPGTPLPPGGIWSSNAPACGRTGGARGRERDRRRDGSGRSRRDARRARASGRGARTGVRVRRRVGGPARPREAAPWRELGFDERFWGVALRPAGRPGSASWRRRPSRCSRSGCPATRCRRWSTFQLFVRPALRALQGADRGGQARDARSWRRRSSAIRAASRRCAAGCARRTTAGTRSRRAPGLARADLDAGRRRAGARAVGRGAAGGRRAGGDRAARRAGRGIFRAVRKHDPRRGLGRRRQAKARVKIVAGAAVRVGEGRQRDDASRPPRSRCRAPRSTASGAPSTSSASAATYWGFLTRISLGLLRVLYTPDSREIAFLGRPFVLLRFSRPSTRPRRTAARSPGAIQEGLPRRRPRAAARDTSGSRSAGPPRR